MSLRTLAASSLAAFAVLTTAAQAQTAPQIVFEGRSPAQVRASIAAACVQSGHIVASSDEVMVRCQSPSHPSSYVAVDLGLPIGSVSDAKLFYDFILVGDSQRTTVSQKLWQEYRYRGSVSTGDMSEDLFATSFAAQILEQAQGD